jgi:hypothetical protein
VKTVIHLDQLGRNADLRTRLAYRTLQDMSNTERVTDTAQVIVLTFERKR